MEDHSKTEVILFTRHSLKDWREKQLVFWLITTGQSEIAKREEIAKKMFCSNLTDTPAIYFS